MKENNHVRMLREVRSRLRRYRGGGGPQYLCIALMEVNHARIGTSDVYLELRDEIEDRLGESTSAPRGASRTLERWLFDRGYLRTPRDPSDEEFEKVQTTRVAWLDSMIEEYGAKA